MGLMIALGIVLIALAIATIILWGMLRALVQVGGRLWRLLKA